MKKLFSAMLLVLSFSNAFANDYTVTAGVIPSAPTSPYSYTFTHDAGSFFDTISFTIIERSLSSSASPLNLILGNTKVLNIDDLQYTIWDQVHPNGIVSYGTFAGNNTTSTIDLFAPGIYHIDISGVASGTSGGIYSLALQTSPAPEPETYAMLMAGLGLMGYVARRRKTQA